MKLDRTFRFRGHRDYLHSTSMFDDLLKLRGADATRIDMKFHRRTAHQVCYVDELPTEYEPVAEWSDTAGRLFVIERDQPITDTEPYDEAALAQMLAIDGRSISIPATTPGFTRIEAIIAGFKKLMQAVRPIHMQYVFVRVRLRYVPDVDLQIRYARDIGAFSEGNIAADDGTVGQIFFGEWA